MVVVFAALASAACDSQDAEPASVETTTATTTTTVAAAGEAVTPTTSPFDLDNSPDPGNETTTVEDEGDQQDDRIAAELALREQPIVIDRGNERIEFDQWFFATLNPESMVTVTIDGAVVVTGRVTDDTVMNQLDDGTFLFLDAAGAVVTTLGVEELNAELERLRAEAGLTE